MSELIGTLVKPTKNGPYFFCYWIHPLTHVEASMHHHEALKYKSVLITCAFIHTL